MADPNAPRRADDIEDVQDQVAPRVQDPAEAHRKGYSADPLREPPVRAETIPLADESGPGSRQEDQR